METNNRESELAGGARSENGAKVRVVVLAFPIVGRTNPMVQFGKRLSSKGVLVTLATTSAFASKLSSSSFGDTITIAALSDPDELGLALSDAGNIDDYTERFERTARRGLAALMKEPEQPPVRCIIYDSSQIWALSLARQLGVFAAPFFTQSCGASLIIRHAFAGDLEVDQRDQDRVIMAPGLPPMGFRDLPSFLQEVGKLPFLEKVVLRQFENFHEADWQFFNTFDALEQEVVDWMRKQWPMLTSVGPSIPSVYLDGRLKDDKEYGLSPFDAEASGACIRWLDAQEDASIVYVSFGSLAELGVAQIEELASGLVESGCPFLWVVRSPEDRERLQSSLSTPGGMIVSWCHQLEVLAHRAVGCFFTHCGWNSILEAISCGVPLVGMPQWADQPSNAMFVEHVWKVGVRVRPKARDEELVTRHEIQARVREVMQAHHMRSNASKFKILAKAAMHQGGSSDTNIENFVAKLSQP